MDRAMCVTYPKNVELWVGIRDPFAADRVYKQYHRVSCSFLYFNGTTDSKSIALFYQNRRFFTQADVKNIGVR